MASSYTTIIDLEKPASGDQDGAWATTANTNYDLIEDAIAAVTTITAASGTDTLTTTQQAANEARNAVINVTSTLSGNLVVEPPDRSKPYLFRNASNQAYTVDLQTSGGTGYEVFQNYACLLWVDPTGSGTVYPFSPQTKSDGSIAFEDATGIWDSNNNEQLIFQEVASAVNYFEMTNSATGVDLILGAAGGDTNIDIDIQAKGSGSVLLNGGAVLSAGTDFDHSTGDFTTGGQIIIDVDGTDVAADGSILMGAGSDAGIYWDGSYMVLDTTTATSGVTIPGPAAQPGLLRLVTEETTVVDGDKLGQIDFLAPSEASGSDAILAGASIWAEADDTFDTTVNTTDLIFATGASEAAVEKMRLTSTGTLHLLEASAANDDYAGFGQLWVKDDTPNALTFTDDAGTDIAITDTNGNLARASGGTIGRQTIWVPAGAMTSSATNGAASGSVEEATNDINYPTLDFDASTDEYAEFSVAFPKGHDLTEVRFQVWWRSTAADTDGVSWGLQALARADNEAIDAAWGTGVVVDDANQGAAGELLVSAESGDVTTSVADDDLCFFRLYRDVSDSNDTATEDAQLVGIKLFYDIDSGTDD